MGGNEARKGRVRKGMCGDCVAGPRTDCKGYKATNTDCGKHAEHRRLVKQLLVAEQRGWMSEETRGRCDAFMRSFPGLLDTTEKRKGRTSLVYLVVPILQPTSAMLLLPLGNCKKQE